jgi:hypothetical protein
MKPTNALLSNELVAWDSLIDRQRPGFYSPGDRLSGREILLAEPVRHAQRAGSVVAEDEQAVVRIEFLVRAGRYLSHGNERTAFNAGSLVFPRFADVDEFGFALPQKAGCVLHCDFVFVHEDRIR